MKRLIFTLLAILAAVTAVRAFENLGLPMSAWQTAVEYPAWGKIETVSTAWRTDSTITFRVRYASRQVAPAASVARTVHSPQPKKYNFGAWVNLTRAGACLTLSVRDAEGTLIASTTVSTEVDRAGALTPGRWTPVNIVADLTDVDSPANTAVTFSIEPMYDGSNTVASDVVPTIEVADIAITPGGPTGLFGNPDLPNAEFETWSHSALGTNRHPVSWVVSNSSRVAGVHANDNAVFVPAGQLISNSMSGRRAQQTSHLRVMARAEKTTTISVHKSPRDKTVMASRTIQPGPWTEIIFPVAIGADLALSADNDWSLDGVRIAETYDFDNPRPTERTLHVTSPDDNGEGSLRDIVDRARTGDRIVFDVAEITLTSAIDLSDKYICIDGQHPVPDRPYTLVPTTIRQATAGQPIFVVNPTVDGTLLGLRYLDLVGEGGGANGGAVTVGDARTVGIARIDMEKMGFYGFSAKTAGGALYLGAPNVETNLYECEFNNCSASNGGAVAFARGASLTIQYSSFNECSTSGPVGAAVASTSTTEAPVTVSHCDFSGCRASSTTGAGAIAIQSVTTPARITRSQFDFCSGGRASAISIYNTTRGGVAARTAITNCTAVNNTGTAPVVATGMTSRYAGPDVVMVNNLINHNGGPGLKINGGSVTGSHNLVENTAVAIDNAIETGDEPIYLEYNADGTPRRNESMSRRPYGIRDGGPVHDKGLKSYKLGDEDLIDETGFEGRSMLYAGMFLSVGASEYIGPDGGAADVVGNPGRVNVWPNPVSTYLNIDGEYSRMWLTDMSGTTVLVGNGATVDVSGIPSGVYLASFDCNGRIYTQKIIIR